MKCLLSWGTLTQLLESTPTNEVDNTGTMTISVTTFSIMTLSIKKCRAQQWGSVLLRRVFQICVAMLNVVAPIMNPWTPPSGLTEPSHLGVYPGEHSSGLNSTVDLLTAYQFKKLFVFVTDTRTKKLAYFPVQPFKPSLIFVGKAGCMRTFYRY